MGTAAAGPRLSVSAIESAIVEQDAQALADHVDFPALRQNLKDQLNAMVTKDTLTDADENPFAALAAGFATTLVDSMVDALVTPRGLTAIMEGNDLSWNGRPVETAQSDKEQLFNDARYTYDSAKQFSVWVPGDAGEELRLVLQRKGLSWKLVNIIVPLNEAA